MDDDSTDTDTMVTFLEPMDTLLLNTSINVPLLNQCMTNSDMALDTVTMVECENPRNGFLLLQDNYCFNYTPNSDFIGQDSFCLVVCTPSLCDSTFIIIDIGSDSLEVFNAFSPNNDNVNDVFTIRNIEKFPDNELQVFNRWGNRVYHKKGYNNEWRGVYDNSLLLPDGIYFYLLEVMEDDIPNTYSGFVQITR
jgi:gliding motility-associated-like protein